MDKIRVFSESLTTSLKEIISAPPSADVEYIINSVEISGGSSAADVTIETYSGTTKVFSQVLPVDANETVILDYVKYIPPGYSMKAKASVGGVRVCLNTIAGDAD